MDWKILDKEGNFLMEANCQYDCCDLASMFYQATKILIDFDNQIATVIETIDSE